MRILVISNFYPPYHIGGYEVGCFEAVEGLQARGHQVKVLTSSYGLDQPEDDGQIFRWLATDIGRGFTTIRLFRREFYNRRVFKRLAETFEPEIIYIWNLWQIPLSLVYLAQGLGVPVSYYIFDHWVAHLGEGDDWFRWWSRPPAPNPLKRWGRRLLERIFNANGVDTRVHPPDFQHAQFASHFLKQQALQAGKPVEKAKVIHWGLNLEQFPGRNPGQASVKRLLYVGQLVPTKGVHTAIEALKLLLEQAGHHALELTIVGGTVLLDYERRLQELVRSFGLENTVHFAGLLPRDQLPAIYREHDIMIVPSSWDEPFGLILLEAMAAGLAVVGTATGGSAEILRHEFNGLVFSRDDAQACADCLLRLLEQPDLFERVCRQGRKTVEQHFQLKNSLQMIEQSLAEAGQPRRSRIPEPVSI